MSLYDKIIKAINKSIYNALNEYNYANADHGHAGNINNTLTLVEKKKKKSCILLKTNTLLKTICSRLLRYSE